MPKIRNIFLDLDETLISAIDIQDLKQNKNQMEEFSRKNRLFKYYLMDDEYIITERPGVQDFLDFVFKHYNVSVWTAASKEYALFVIEKVILKHPSRKINYILFSEHCDHSKDRSGCLKQLNQIFHFAGYNRHNTVIIDDNRNVQEKQKNIVIAAKPFHFFGKNSEKDDQLLKIQKKLLGLEQPKTSKSRKTKLEHVDSKPSKKVKLLHYNKE